MNNVFQGTATNADNLGSRPASDYVLTSGDVMSGVLQLGAGSYVTTSQIEPYGKVGYIHIATITVEGTRQNSPIYMKILHRNAGCDLFILFESVNNTDPSLEQFMIYNTIGVTRTSAYIYKKQSSVWELYIRKVEPYDTVAVAQYSKSTYMDSVTVKFESRKGVETLPDGAIQADFYSWPSVWPAMRKLTVSGDATGSVSFSGASDIPLTLDVKQADNATTATTATKLSISAGSATQPIYFSSGKPVATTYTLAKSVPSNAVFTDTTYKAGSGLYLGSGTFKVYCPRVQKSANSLPGQNSVMIEEYTPGSTYNLPDSTTWYHIITIEGTDVKYATQLALGVTADKAYYRKYNQEAWGSWKSIINTDTTYTLSSFGITATATELNYCDGVTSNIQTQLNGKLPTNGKAASATKADTATTATTATNSNQLGGVAAANFINTSDTVILKGVV